MSPRELVAPSHDNMSATSQRTADRAAFGLLAYRDGALRVYTLHGSSTAPVPIVMEPTFANRPRRSTHR